MGGLMVDPCIGLLPKVGCHKCLVPKVGRDLVLHLTVGRLMGLLMEDPLSSLLAKMGHHMDLLFAVGRLMGLQMEVPFSGLLPNGAHCKDHQCSMLCQEDQLAGATVDHLQGNPHHMLSTSKV